MLDVGKEGEPIDYQLKRLEGQTKPKELGEVFCLGSSHRIVDAD